MSGGSSSSSKRQQWWQAAAATAQVPNPTVACTYANVQQWIIHAAIRYCALNRDVDNDGNRHDESAARSQKCCIVRYSDAVFTLAATVCLYICLWNLLQSGTRPLDEKLARTISRVLSFRKCCVLPYEAAALQQSLHQLPSMHVSVLISSAAIRYRALDETLDKDYIESVAGLRALLLEYEWAQHGKALAERKWV